MTEHITDKMVEAAIAAFRKAEGKDAMRLALAAAFRAAWRPIEEAPKDGTKFIAKFLGKPVIASWNDVMVPGNLKLVAHDPPWFDGRNTVTEMTDGLGRLPDGIMYAPLMPLPPSPEDAE